jgi:hypothetical protein
MIQSWPKGYSLAINDIPRRLGGGSSWEMIPSSSEKNDLYTSDLNDADDFNCQSVLSYAHQALGLSVSASKRNQSVDTKELQRIVHCAKV